MLIECSWCFLHDLLLEAYLEAAEEGCTIMNELWCWEQIENKMTENVQDRIVHREDHQQLRNKQAQRRKTSANKTNSSGFKNQSNSTRSITHIETN